MKNSIRVMFGQSKDLSSRLVLAPVSVVLATALGACAATPPNAASVLAASSPTSISPVSAPTETITQTVNSHAAAKAVSEGQDLYITLGTNGGPVANRTRSQSSNALRVDGDLYLVDAGDGAAGQLAKAGLELEDVKGVFLSHLHFDHTGGMLAVLGLRRQVNANTPLSVYGPPGTKFLIDGLLASMGPTMKAAYGMPGQEWRPNVDVTELVDGSVVERNGLTVTVAENSHFAIPESAGMPEKAKSLSFRFDMADRSIAFTGDTGPSDKVVKLAHGADLLVSELMDIPAILGQIKKRSPYMPEKVFGNIEWHFRAHHLTPGQVGELAAAAEVKALVVTHIAPSIDSEEYAQEITAAIAAKFSGPITLAADLQHH